MKINLTKSVQMPLVGFGTYLIRDEDVQPALLKAFQAGYRHVDTAEAYGNENGVGRAIAHAVHTMGIPREDIFVTTKLWPGNADWGQTPKTYTSTIDSLNASLERLGLDYVDHYLIHAPFPREQRLDQWRALIELKRLGKARTVGVSNFSAVHIEEIKTAGLPLPDANQIELHPWSQKTALVSYLIQQEITIVAYSSLAPLSSWRATEGQASAKTETMRAEGTVEDAPFKIMAKTYGVSEAQVLLRWAIQKGYAVLPKSTNQERILQNIDLFSFEINEKDMTAIAEMERGAGLAWQSGDPIKAA